jgi:NAD+ kinase
VDVLIVTKTTNYELHGPAIEAKVEQGRVARDALARLTTAHAEHYATLARVRAALDRAKVRYQVVSRESMPEVPASRQPGGAPSHDVVVTVGGDGTLLAATHQIGEDGMVFGIRSSTSSVGYLCCGGADDVEAIVRRVVAGKGPFVNVSRLRAEVHRVQDGQRVMTNPVLNDVLYTNANPAATTRYRLTFGERGETHRSSGIWVATGAGSTAAILAAGGERRPIDDRWLQFKVRELYRLGHVTPTIDGGLLDPDIEPLTIENRCDKALLALDGQHGIVELVYGDVVRFLRAPSVRLAQPDTAGS